MCCKHITASASNVSVDILMRHQQAQALHPHLAQALNLGQALNLAHPPPQGALQAHPDLAAPVLG